MCIKYAVRICPKETVLDHWIITSMYHKIQEKIIVHLWVWMNSPVNAVVVASDANVVRADQPLDIVKMLCQNNIKVNWINTQVGNYCIAAAHQKHFQLLEAVRLFIFPLPNSKPFLIEFLFDLLFTAPKKFQKKHIISYLKEISSSQVKVARANVIKEQ